MSSADVLAASTSANSRESVRRRRFVSEFASSLTDLAAYGSVSNGKAAGSNSRHDLLEGLLGAFAFHFAASE